MKPIRLAILSAALVLLLPRPAASDAAGFAFLEVPAGARAAALGGAYTTLARGVDAAFWNVAALDQVRGIQVAGTHAEYIETLRHDHFALAGRLFGGGVAASVRAMYSEPIEERDELGDLVGSFGAHDLEFGLAYGRTLAPGLSLGAGAQLVRERIADASAQTWSVGFGALWEPAPLRGVRLGVSAEHLGPADEFVVEGVPGAPVALPAAVQAGGSWEGTLGRGAWLRTALEARATRGRNAVGLLGVEVATAGGADGAGSAALRTGLRVNDDVSGFSLGAGYALGGLRLDYAFVPLKLDLGDTHRISFTAQF
jgi:hypothetical protein